MSLIDPSAVRSAFAQLTGLEVQECSALSNGNMKIRLYENKYAKNHRNLELSAHEALMMIGKAMLLESLEKRAIEG